MPPRRRKTLTDIDLGEWAAYTRHVLPLSGKPMPQTDPPPAVITPGPTPPEPGQPTAVVRPTGKPQVGRPGAAHLTVGDNPGGLDKSSWNRLRTGRLAPTRTLDLHGRTAQRAYHALVAFLHAAHADQIRCVEVITGRGAGEAGGVIRREFPLWLNQPALRPLVLAASHPHPANPGSVRLLLRRAR